MQQSKTEGAEAEHTDQLGHERRERHNTEDPTHRCPSAIMPPSPFAPSPGDTKSDQLIENKRICIQDLPLLTQGYLHTIEDDDLGQQKKKEAVFRKCSVTHTDKNLTRSVARPQKQDRRLQRLHPVHVQRSKRQNRHNRRQRVENTSQVHVVQESRISRTTSAILCSHPQL